MSEQKNELEENERPSQQDDSVSWGPKLFYGVFIAVLVFFWWLAIYSHGVTPTH